MKAGPLPSGGFDQPRKRGLQLTLSAVEPEDEVRTGRALPRHFIQGMQGGRAERNLTLLVAFERELVLWLWPDKQAAVRGVGPLRVEALAKALPGIADPLEILGQVAKVAPYVKVRIFANQLR